MIWSELRIPSGLAALLVATVPLWITAIDWSRPGGGRPPAPTLLGIALGLGAQDYCHRVEHLYQTIERVLAPDAG